MDGTAEVGEEGLEGGSECDGLPKDPVGEYWDWEYSEVLGPLISPAKNGVTRVSRVRVDEFCTRIRLRDAVTVIFGVHREKEVDSLMKTCYIRLSFSSFIPPDSRNLRFLAQKNRPTIRIIKASTPTAAPRMTGVGDLEAELVSCDDVLDVASELPRPPVADGGKGVNVDEPERSEAVINTAPGTDVPEVS